MDSSSPSKRQRTLPLVEAFSARGFDDLFDGPLSDFLEDENEGDDLIDLLPQGQSARGFFTDALPAEQDDDDIGEKPATEDDDVLRDLLAQGQSALGLSGFLSSEEDEENQDPIYPRTGIPRHLVVDTAASLALLTDFSESEKEGTQEKTPDGEADDELITLLVQTQPPLEADGELMGLDPIDDAGVDTDGQSHPDSSSAEEEDIEEEDTEEIVKTYRCDHPHCKQSYWHRSGLRKHKRSKHKKIPYPCNFPGCDEVFMASTTLYRHWKKKGHQYYKCQYSDCDEGFTKSTDLQEHRETAHQGPYPCPDCDRKYPYVESLRDHQATKHQGKTYPCDFPDCDLSFADRRNLNRHKHIHKGKPCTCDHPDCDKSDRVYKTQLHLRRHKKTKHGSA